MPRSPNGLDFSPVHEFSPLNIDGSRRAISSTEVNENNDDIGDELVNSLPRDGRAPMAAPLRAFPGVVAAPGLTFEGDADTGFAWTASGTIAVVSNGVQIGTISPTGISSIGDDARFGEAQNDAFFFAATL